MSKIQNPSQMSKFKPNVRNPSQINHPSGIQTVKYTVQDFYDLCT